jgi:hypothetical protein
LNGVVGLLLLDFPLIVSAHREELAEGGSGLLGDHALLHRATPVVDRVRSHRHFVAERFGAEEEERKEDKKESKEKERG